KLVEKGNNGSIPKINIILPVPLKLNPNKPKESEADRKTPLEENNITNAIATTQKRKRAERIARFKSTIKREVNNFILQPSHSLFALQLSHFEQSNHTY